MTHIIATRKASSSQEIMDLDQQMLGRPETILHLYSWPEPTATYGCLVNPQDFIDLEKANEHNLHLAKRPTGGGIIFHLTDLAFSFLLPSSSPYFSQNTEENYRFVNGLVAKALDISTSLLTDEAPGASRFCMAKATKYDLMLGGGKLVGAAQRRTKAGYLHQGSISLCPPPFALIKEVLRAPVFEAMQETSRFLYPDSTELEDKRFLIEQKLINTFSNL